MYKAAPDGLGTYFNFVTDGFANMRRIVYTKKGIFQFEFAVIPFIKYTAEELAKWADEKTTLWSCGALKKHNSQATDNISVMRFFQSIIEQKPI